MFHNPYSSHYYNVPNPSCPYNDQIPNGLVPGKQILIRGTVHGDADRLQFNLNGPMGTILHINPRFHDGCIVRNSAEHGNWQSEERDGPLLFTPTENFELNISVEHDKYVVTVNGQHAFDYNHRIAVQEVQQLQIEGSQTITQILYSEGRSAGNDVHGPSVPFATPIWGGLMPGKMVQITGSCSGQDRFEVNLQSGPMIPSGDIQMHFNPRWNDPSDGVCVVRTNCQGGGWGSEERDVPFPFPVGNFDLLILCDPHQFKVAVNGQHYISYNHNGNFSAADHISISGDVDVHTVRQF